MTAQKEVETLTNVFALLTQLPGDFFETPGEDVPPQAKQSLEM